MRRCLAPAAASTVLLSVALSVAPGYADSPLPPPAERTIWSPNRRFFAVMSPSRWTTTVYRATTPGRGAKAWAMYGWFRVASLADDGEHLVTGYDGVNLLPPDHDKRQVMAYFFRRGELINVVTLDQLIRDPSKLQRTASHYAWGNFLGLDQAGRYVAETVEGRTIRFDVKTGETVRDPRPRRRPETPR